ncbi:MAG: hypothetical protein WC975_06340 [Phycisphaerae bacterium]
MKTLKFVLPGILVLAICLGAKTINKDTGYRTKADHFLTSVMVIKINEAYDKLLENSQLKKKTEAIDGLQKQTSAALALLGKPTAFELVKEQRYGESLVRLVYVLKFDIGPLIWEFYFYKPRTDWMLINIEFNDKLDMLGDK